MLQRARKRFNELVIKEALSNISPSEHAKLDRYCRLLRPRRIHAEIACIARNEYRLRLLKKMIGHERYHFNET